MGMTPKRMVIKASCIRAKDREQPVSINRRMDKRETPEWFSIKTEE